MDLFFLVELLNIFFRTSYHVFLVPCLQIISSGRPYVFICSRFVSRLAVPSCLSLYLIGHPFAFRAEGVQKSVKSVPPSPPDVPLASLAKGISYLPFLPSSSHLWEICKAIRLCVLFFPCRFPNVPNCSVCNCIIF